jgi:hypothetical protein
VSLSPAALYVAAAAAVAAASPGGGRSFLRPASHRPPQSPVSPYTERRLQLAERRADVRFGLVAARITMHDALLAEAQAAALAAAAAAQAAAAASAEDDDEYFYGDGELARDALAAAAVEARGARRRVAALAIQQSAMVGLYKLNAVDP